MREREFSNELFRALRIQKGVFNGLMMREIQTRWGRRNLGFAWIFVEPLAFGFPVLVMWRLIRGPNEHMFALIPFMWSGYFPLMIFRHITGSSVKLVSASVSLLFHRRVTPFDLFFSHVLLEFLGNLAAMTISFWVFYLFGEMIVPKDFPLFLAGILMMGWWSVAVALVVVPLSERYEIIGHIWGTISYMYLPISGFFYVCAWLPSSIRAIALAALPSVHAYEMIRAGLFGSQFHAYYDIGYASFYLSILTFAGMWMLLHLRKHLEI